ncbi:unnamed protein product [Phytophthora fragariaefolia]|uniref:Unnamed protein product n=1 Tax=Phytophthora fragariaefolia TaxID=1490495 RepID=A0A9W6U1M8_9STRA|nr:unnamed protein product [Phytophthora fragariaefolia]
MPAVKAMASKQKVGVKINANDLNSYDCVACTAGKAKRMNHANRSLRELQPLSILMMDVCSMDEPTARGATMFLYVVDEVTRYKWAYLMEAREDTTYYLIKLMNELRTQFNQFQVQRLHSDQGGEFASTELETYCAKEGIILQTTNGYLPQENGVVERANGVVLPRIRALQFATPMPDLLWGEALLHVVDTLNKLPTQPLSMQSPHERLYGAAPDLSVLRTWGCLAWDYIPPESRRRKEKLKPRARLSLLLGYSSYTKGYKFLDLLTCQVVTAQGGNAHFHEDFTAEGDYVKHLLENNYLDCMH